MKTWQKVLIGLGLTGVAGYMLYKNQNGLTVTSAIYGSGSNSVVN